MYKVDKLSNMSFKFSIYVQQSNISALIRTFMINEMC